MKHTIKIIFGKEQVDKFIANIPLTKDEKEINLKEYSFDSEAEMLAFKKGVNEAIGWVECYFVEIALCEG
jgi:hypothetical protein